MTILTSFRSYPFRCFMNEFSVLSRIHWYFEFSSKYALDDFSKKFNTGQSKYLSDVITLSNFDTNRIHIPIKQFISENNNHLSHLRMLLLVKGCASLEDFLHRYIKYYAIYSGFVGTNKNKLNVAGDALIKPGMVSNLKSSLLYIKSLMDLTIDSAKLENISSAYQIRCAAAHNGGVVDHETIRKLPNLQAQIGQRIYLEWPELQNYLQTIHEVASTVEGAIPVKELREIDANWLLQGLFDTNRNLTAKTARKLLITEYNFHGAPDRAKIAQQFGCRVS